VIRLAASLLLCATAAADGATAPPASLPGAPGPIALTVSGGVSLGAWEAGFMHYTTGVIRENAGHNQVRLVTGASAGAANALMGIVAEYGPPAPTPEGSIFHRTWIPLGLSQLFVPAETGRQGAFSRRWAGRLWTLIEEGLRAGLSVDCDVVLGVSLTRLVPREVAIVPGVELPRVEEHAALRITGRGPGRLPRFVNYVDPDWDQAQLLLPEGPDREVPLWAVRDLLFASAAFPVAFPPQRLRHCLRRPQGGPRLDCPEAEATGALFADGGLLDNSPIRLAARLAGTGLRFDEAGRARWLKHPRLGEWLTPRGASFAYVSPDVAAYPLPEAKAQVDAGTPVLALGAQLAGAFFATARAKNLLVLLDERPELARALLVPRRHYPTASEPMAAFLGFFETELRRFDFTLGMVEAGLMFDEREAVLAAELGLPVEIARPDARHPSPEWRRLDCLRAALGERPEAGPRCAGADLRELRILAQASLFRLWDQCTLADGEVRPSTSHAQCRRAMEGAPPPLVPGVEGAAGVAWRRAPGEGELDHALRILGAMRFWWRDLGLSPDEGSEALGEIRQVAGRVVEALVAAQPAQDRLVVGTVGGMAANWLAYAPARHRLWITLGRELEVGFSHGLLADRRRLPLRPHLAVQVHGALAAVSSDETPAGLALLAGVELLPWQLATDRLQPSLILRGGVLLSPRDDWGALRCPTPASSDPAACTRPALQAVAALSVLERVRLHLGGELYPTRAGRRLWSVAPAIGFQLNF
jgi:hypothetical protein